MKSILKYINLLVNVRNLIPCLFFMVLVGCNDANEYQLPPPLPTTSEPEPEIPLEEYQDYPSLLTSTESTRLEALEKTYDSSINLLSGGTYLSTLEYVVLLFKQGEATSIQRAESILKTIINAQVTDESSSHYGNWPWGINYQVNDRNPPLFFARRMLGEIWDLQSRMLTEMKTAYVKSCERLTVAAERRWDEEIFAANRAGVAYTNVYSLYIETLTLAGKRFDDERLKQLSKEKWTVFYNNFSVHGLDEFLSRDYDDITFRALLSTKGFVTESQQSDQIKEVMDYIYVLKSAVTHPILNTPIVGISRDDRKYINGSDARSEFLKTVPEGYTPPDEAEELKYRSYPFEVKGRAGSYTFTFQSYQLQNVAMGSMTGWGSYYSQQVHFMTSIGTSTAARATLFMPGSYIHVNGFTDQKELSTLCVYNRLPTLWHRDQWRGNQNDISSTLFDFGIGLSTQWNEVSSQVGKIVLRSRGYDVHIYPYIVENNQIKASSLTKVKRSKTSEKYHVEDLSFEELLFPSEPLWFGVYIKVVPENTAVPTPTISFKEENGLMIFSTDEGHQIKVGEEDGVSVQVRDTDPYLMPRFYY